MKPQYKVFVNGILKGLKPEQAAIEAGYSPRSARLQGTRLMQNDTICAEIDTRQAELQERTVEKTALTAAFVIEGLIDVANSCRASDKPGTATPALGLLGKHLGLFIDRSEVTVTGETMKFLDAVIGIIDQEVQDMDTRGRIVARMAKLQDSLDD